MSYRTLRVRGMGEKAAEYAATATKEKTMTQYFLSLPHDSAEEPVMATMDPAELQALFAAVDAFNTGLKEAGRGCSPGA